MTHKKKHIKYKIVIMIQYKIAKNVLFAVQYHKDYNKININHSPY